MNTFYWVQFEKKNMKTILRNPIGKKNGDRLQENSPNKSWQKSDALTFLAEIANCPS
jgi:hypothetical protein